MWKAKVIVTYKPGILDPEAKTIHNALRSLGYEDISELDTGKYFQMTYTDKISREDAENLTQEICTKLLSNPVIQKYAYELIEVS